MKHGDVKTDNLIQADQMSVRIQANFDQVWESVGQIPKKSFEKRNQELGTKMGSFTRERPKTVPPLVSKSNKNRQIMTRKNG